MTTYPDPHILRQIYATGGISALALHDWCGVYWRQRADERLGDHPPKVNPGAFSGQRQGWKTPRGPLAVHCFSVRSGSVLLGDLLGVSRSRERDLLSVLLIYRRIFLHVFIAYRLLVGFLFVWLYSAICSCVLVALFVSTGQVIGYRKTPLMTLHEVRRLSPRGPGGRACLYVFFFRLICLCCSPVPT